MYNKRKIIKLIIFYSLILLGARYIFDVGHLVPDPTIFEVNADRQGFSGKYETAYIYIIFILAGFNYLYDEYDYRLVKYSGSINYFNKYVFKIICIVSVVFATIHNFMNIVYNLSYFNMANLLEHNFFIANFSNSIIVIFFCIITLFIYSIVMVFLKRNTSMVVVVLLNVILFYIQDKTLIRILPISHVGKIADIMMQNNLNSLLISLFVLGCYIVIIYYLLESIYKQKEYI